MAGQNNNQNTQALTDAEKAEVERLANEAAARDKATADALAVAEAQAKAQAELEAQVAADSDIAADKAEIVRNSSLQNNDGVFEAQKAATPDRERDGKLTRAGMEAAIRDGGSVQMSDGSVISKIEDLPTDATLAKGDATEEARVRAELEAQRAVIDAQLASLK